MPPREFWYAVIVVVSTLAGWALGTLVGDTLNQIFNNSTILNITVSHIGGNQ